MPIRRRSSASIRSFDRSTAFAASPFRRRLPRRRRRHQKADTARVSRDPDLQPPHRRAGRYPCPGAWRSPETGKRAGTGHTALAPVGPRCSERPSSKTARLTEDPVALGEQYTQHASWTNARGTRLDGREEIAGFSAPAMKSFLHDSFARYDVVKMLETAPDVIAVNVVQTPTSSTGNPVDGPRGATLHVIAGQVDGWRIAAGQNTAVAPQAV
ncbi:SgcJ/EcaC family oxidoreductase [Streptomyces sp. NPDC014646]|uniref:SgcJ/EcaC family oxidoreductase n=1 Tax=Streptomyces sp. NPDC014646 TaxID=3364877 RepID=UPI0037031229